MKNISTTNRFIFAILFAVAMLTGGRYVNKIVYGDTFPGISVEKNYVLNPDFENKDVYDWTASSGTVALKTTGTDRLNGGYSAEWTPGALNATLKGSLRSIDNGISKSKETCWATARYNFASNGTSGSQGYQFYFEDSGGTPITQTQTLTATYDALAGTSPAPGKATVFFPCSKLASGSKPVFKFVQSSASNLVYDDVIVGVASVPLSPYITTAWTSWTPTFTGLGTVTSVSLQYRQEGPNMLIKGRFTCGTPTATQAGFSLPNGALPVTDIGWQTTGMYWKSATSADKGGPLLYLTNPANNFLFFGPVTTVGSTSADPTNAANGTVVCGAGQTVIISGVSIPIAGWENNSVNVVTAQNWNFDWRNCPTGFTASWTGAVSVTCKYKRQGGDGHFEFTATTSGAPTGSTLQFTLPTGLTFDTGRMGSSISFTPLLASSGKVNDSGSPVYDAEAVYNNTTTVTVMAKQTSSVYASITPVNLTTPITFGSGDTVTVKFVAQISENGIPWIETWNALQVNGSLNAGNNVATPGPTRVEVAQIVVGSSCSVTQRGSWLSTNTCTLGGSGFVISPPFKSTPICVAGTTDNTSKTCQIYSVGASSISGFCWTGTAPGSTTGVQGIIAVTCFGD